MTALRKFLRFVLCVPGAVVLGVRLLPEAGAIEIEVRRRADAKPRCSTCGRLMGGTPILRRHRWRHLDLMRRMTFLVADIREARCPVHGRRLERVPWATPGARHTRRFDEHVASLVQVADRSAAARMFRVAWRTVGGIVERVVGERLSRRRLNGLVAIGVDETSYKRGHRYLTVVSCLVTGKVVWVGEGSTAETLGRFFAELGPYRSRKLAVVAMDMSEAYQKAVREHAPQAEIIFDRFHVVQLLLKAVDEVRREQCRALHAEARRAIKGARFAFLRNPKHYTDKDYLVVAQIQRSNNRLARLYQRRVDFEALWDCRDEHEARHYLMSWTRSALLSRLEPLRRVAHTMRKHIDGILAYFRYDHTTNAVLEGTNNKIKLIIHRAFGFHSVKALLSMVYLCCSGLSFSLD